MTDSNTRIPYVGAGEDGCRRSAQIDRDLAKDLGWSDPRKDELLDSAQRWEKQAYELMLERVGPAPSLAELRSWVGSERWLTAIALLDLSPAIANDAARFTQWAQSGGRYTYEGEREDRVANFHPDPEIDWERWATDVDEQGRGWSSTEWRLFELVAALTVPDRKVAIVGVLDRLGSWERPALAILLQWASGGNNRELPGRLTATGRSDA